MNDSSMEWLWRP
jgi:lysosomal alpha-mannosidase